MFHSCSTLAPILLCLCRSTDCVWESITQTLGSRVRFPEFYFYRLVYTHRLKNSQEKTVQVQKDSKEQPYVEWDQGNGCYKRAWVQR